MKHTVLITIRSTILEQVNAKSFLAELANRFTKSDKVEISAHLNKLVNMYYNSKENVREYIIKISNLVSTLKALKL